MPRPSERRLHLARRRASDRLRLMARMAALAAACLLVVACAAQSARFDGAALVRDLRLLSADEMEGRETGTAGAARARALLVDRFRTAGLQPFGDNFEHPFIQTGVGTAGVNVVGYVDGTSAPTRYIVVSAHYDHLGIKDGRIFNGANDNASGAAALAAIAGHFVRHRPRSSVIVVAFDAEEAGLAGSRAFVRNPPVDRASILINLNLDMIGRDLSNTLYVVGTFRQPALEPLVARVAAAAPVNLRTGYDDPEQGRDRDWTRDSDQWSFLEAGIPALYFGVEDFALHHDADDDFESMTLDFYARAVETIILAIETIDGEADMVASITAGQHESTP